MCKYGACVWPACEQVSRCAFIAFTCFLNCLAPPSFTATPHNGRRRKGSGPDPQMAPAYYYYVA